MRTLLPGCFLANCYRKVKPVLCRRLLEAMQEVDRAPENQSRPTLMPILIGSKGSHTLTVTPDIAVNFLGLENARVLGTPFLILHLEMASRNLAFTQLDPGFDTVGTLVNVRHLAATPMGMQATFHSEIVAVEDRRIQFKVEAFDEREKIAEGLHERAIVNVERFAARVQAKRKM
jgi:predicted thioesterase